MKYEKVFKFIATYGEDSAFSVSHRTDDGEYWIVEALCDGKPSVEVARTADKNTADLIRNMCVSLQAGFPAIRKAL